MLSLAAAWPLKCAGPIAGFSCGGGLRAARCSRWRLIRRAAWLVAEVDVDDVVLFIAAGGGWNVLGLTALRGVHIGEIELVGGDGAVGSGLSPLDNAVIRTVGVDARDVRNLNPDGIALLELAAETVFELFEGAVFVSFPILEAEVLLTAAAAEDIADEMAGIVACASRDFSLRGAATMLGDFSGHAERPLGDLVLEAARCIGGLGVGVLFADVDFGCR